ncbi:globin [Fulvivirga lutea]|uniref:Globin n=1 Tax=Fulvivirga lutea TaxID=2810512 RepID=A0A974ZZK6_9BACT|nr:globin [Fulvivirga lutea]QSE96339.1 globin [Fulvivirga lutea]
MLFSLYKESTVMEVESIQDKISIVQNSYGRCLASGDVLDTFYQEFLGSSPEIKERFKNTDFEKQKKLLKHGINLMIMFAAENLAGKSGLKRIRESHDSKHLNINPKLYDLWKFCLLQAIKSHDYKYNNLVESSWNNVLDKGIRYIKEGY